MSTCFVIMPITTPEGLIEEYQGDKNHFVHVYDHLFEPAIEFAELTPISPLAKGADIIQARIIKEIENADIVLCDMSTLNANVFFELGIRVALNKKICLVKDNKTKKIPFDTGIINCHTYDSSLTAWVQDDETDKLSTHIKDSLKADDQHSLWNLFSLGAQAELTSEENGLEAKIDYLSIQVAALRNKINEELQSPGPSFSLKWVDDNAGGLLPKGYSSKQNTEGLRLSMGDQTTLGEIASGLRPSEKKVLSKADKRKH